LGGVFLKIYQVAQQFKVKAMYAFTYFDKEWFGPHFGRFFIDSSGHPGWTEFVGFIAFI
jgi:hypothetical protein